MRKNKKKLILIFEKCNLMKNLIIFYSTTFLGKILKNSSKIGKNFEKIQQNSAEIVEQFWLVEI